MSRIPAVDPAQTEGKTRETLDAVHKMLGGTPNLFRVAANSPAVLEGLVGLIGALSKGSFRSATREALALTVAEANGCDYCLSAHSALGSGAGMNDQEISLARDAASKDPKTAAALNFARTVVTSRGNVEEAAIRSARNAGLTDAQLLEVVGNVTVNIFTNYLNLVADTDIDFPVVRARKG